MTSNNLLMEEDKALSKGKGLKRPVAEKAIICVNSIADSYYHIQENFQF